MPTVAEWVDSTGFKHEVYKTNVSSVFPNNREELP